MKKITYTINNGDIIEIDVLEAVATTLEKIEIEEKRDYWRTQKSQRPLI